MRDEMKYVWIICGILLLTLGVVLFTPASDEDPIVIINEDGSVSDSLKQFSSIDEIEKYVEDSRENYGGANVYSVNDGLAVESFAESAVSARTADSSASASSSGAGDYSSTNIQVEGVDEPDIVKNDGKYIYSIVGKKVVIVDAFPAESMDIVSEIEFEESINELFLYGDTLVVIGNKYEYIDSGISCPTGGVGIGFRCGGYSIQQTLVYLYDVSNRGDPELEEFYSIDGYHVDSRMIGEHVYLISSKDISYNFFELPGYSISSGERTSVAADSISYFGGRRSNYVFNLVSAIDVKSQDIETETFLMDRSYNLYVSTDSIYLTYRKQLSQDYLFEKYVDDVLEEVLPSSVMIEVEAIVESDDSLRYKWEDVNREVERYSRDLDREELEEFLLEFEELYKEYSSDVSSEQDKTVIHKINIDEMDIDYDEMGEVPGHVNNQFSMDEYRGNFRIATTSGNFWSEESLNNLYILDDDMDVVGSVEGLAEGERIYSARFMGDRAYMVTFRQVDPLYVIDVSDPKEPEVLGYLKVTGFSSYLHPYDENHLIGVGREATEEGRAEGVKIALFDVSDVENPIEMSKYEITNGRWSHSEALYDHKAFLFDKDRELLVIPVSYSDYQEHWQGAYVFGINLVEGIELEGKITHELDEPKDYWYRSGEYVRRSLYMDDVLYTISNKLVKANKVVGLEEVNSVELPYENEYGIVYGRAGIAVAEPSG